MTSTSMITFIFNPFTNLVCGSFETQRNETRLPYICNQFERKVFKTNQPTFNFSKLTSLIHSKSGDPWRKSWRVKVAPGKGDLCWWLVQAGSPLPRATPVGGWCRQGRPCQGRPLLVVSLRQGRP